MPYEQDALPPAENLTDKEQELQQAAFLADVDTNIPIEGEDVDALVEDVVEGARFATRKPIVETPDEAVTTLRTPDEADPSAEDEEDPLATWSSKPSVRDQVTRFPDTVRWVDPTVCVLNLSNPDHLVKLNEILKLTSGDYPSSMITDQERAFHKGSWHVFLSHSKIEYQKL